MIRLQKYLADAGVASRRASEEIIRAGRVTVNGETVDQLGARIDPEHDRVAVDSQPVRVRRRLYVALHKPPGYISSRRDESKRKTVMDLLPAQWSHLFPVGRLDYETEGLLFLTNDGDFSLHLTHPRYGIPKTYVAVIEGRITVEILDRFKRGVRHKGEELRARKARLISANNTRSVVELVLTEGKNREVRRLFESEGFRIQRLARIQIGPVKLGELPTGKWRTLTEAEIKSLLSP
jgi:23S rRNA pseudouridine2605 synthase